MALDGPPEIGALEGVLVLGSADVDSTQGIILGLENRRLHRLLDNALTAVFVPLGLNVWVPMMIFTGIRKALTVVDVPVLGAVPTI